MMSKRLIWDLDCPTTCLLHFCPGFTFCLQRHLRVTFACSQTSQRKKTFSVEELGLLCHWLKVLLQNPARCNGNSVNTCRFTMKAENMRFRKKISLDTTSDSDHNFCDGQDDEIKYALMLVSLNFLLA